MRLAVDEPGTEQTKRADEQADAMDVAAVAKARHGHEHEGGKEGGRVLRRITYARPFAAGLVKRVVLPRRAEDGGHGIREMDPHAEQAEPCKELHDGEPAHSARHLRDRSGDFA